jgi:protein-S-isoprenylcysteine O-methyltransferase Ste14
MSGNAPSGEIAGVVARPPVIFLGYLALAFVLAYFWPWEFIGDALERDSRIALGAAMALAGLVLIIVAFVQFRRAGTNIETWRPTQAIVTRGLYGYSRNPIYVGQTLIYLGLTVLGDNLWALILLVPTLMMIRYGVIAREEAYLERKFGVAYIDYKDRVRRWF